MSDAVRQTRMAWTKDEEGNPVVLVQIDAYALLDLATGGAVIARAPRNAEGDYQILAILGPLADAPALAAATARARTAHRDLPPLTPKEKHR